MTIRLCLGCFQFSRQALTFDIRASASARIPSSYSLRYLGNSLFKSLFELRPVAVAVALTLGLGVHNECAIGSTRILRIVIDINFESSRDALVLPQLNFEHAWVFGLDAVCNRRGVAVVASAPAEFDEDKVTRLLASPVQFLHLFGLLGSHYY